MKRKISLLTLAFFCVFLVLACSRERTGERAVEPVADGAMKEAAWRDRIEERIKGIEERLEGLEARPGRGQESARSLDEILRVPDLKKILEEDIERPEWIEVKKAKNLKELKDNCLRLLRYGPVNSSYEPTKVDAVVALGLAGDKEATQILHEFLKHGQNEHLRNEIVKALAWLKDSRSFAVLVDTLKNDPHDHCRCMAAFALGEIGEEAAFDSLKGALNDSDGNVRRYAAKALEKLRGEKTAEIDVGESKTLDELLDGCTEILKFGPHSSPYEPEKATAATTIGLIGNRRATPTLLEYLENERNDHLRHEIVKALAWLRDPAAVAPLTRILLQEDYEHLRGMAAVALGEIGEKKAIPALERAAKEDPYEYARDYAREALRKIRGK